MTCKQEPTSGSCKLRGTHPLTASRHSWPPISGVYRVVAPYGWNLTTHDPW